MNNNPEITKKDTRRQMERLDFYRKVLENPKEKEEDKK